MHAILLGLSSSFTLSNLVENYYYCLLIFIGIHKCNYLSLGTHVFVGKILL